MQSSGRWGDVDSMSALECSSTVEEIWPPLHSVLGQDVIEICKKAHARSQTWHLHLSVSVKSSYWMLFPSCRRQEMGENSIMANVKTLNSERQFLKRTAWLLPNEWRCHESAARTLHYDGWVQRDVGPLLDFRVIQLTTEVISVQTMWMFPCWCLNGFFLLVSHWSTPNWDSIIIRMGRGCN